ncbi:MAG TPA: TonB-dependent receptor [Gemmatimonadaceae bacterium]|nr:TonB-dependent receptor [Gemmatimonadaceae bacterium]
MIASAFGRFARKAFVLGLGVALPLASAAGQTTTGIIRGNVTDPTGAPLADVAIVARSTDLNIERGTRTVQNGFYAIPGLRPGVYEVTVRRIGYGPQTRTIQLLIGQTQTLDFSLATAAAELSAIVVTAAVETETRTSEIATNVTREQIQDLPTSDRNFLGLAALAPGVRLQNDRLDGLRKTFSAGAQPAEQVNVFIDGASYKNDMLQGGVLGQDASRGSPFPRNAMQEFRVIAQNFKAEYQRAGSAIITATTRSGGPFWEGEAFLNMTGDRWVALDTFQRRDRAANPTTFRQPDFDRRQFGASAGGPVGERWRVFGSFEVNDQERASRVNLPIPPAGNPALDTINFGQYNGEFGQPFRSNLFFAKATFDQSPTSTFELSYNGRHENDIRNFGGMTAYTASTLFRNDVHTGTAKYTRVLGDLLNEAFASYQYYNYNPVPNQAGPISRFFGDYGGGCCVRIGSNISYQDFTQQRFSLRDDVTWTAWQWLGSHIVKGGVNLDFVNYDISKRNSEVPTFVFEPWFNNFSIPQRVEFQFGDPNFGGNNTQIGLFIQDDWSPTPRLTLNLGVRWDYETAMMNYDWVTPPGVVQALNTHEDSLFLPLDRERYFTDGNDRSPFLGAIQPRLGASYALDASGRTTVFGGWGIYYDRNIYDIAIEEQFAIQHPGYRVEFVPPGDTPGPNQLEFDPVYMEEGLPALVDALASINALNPEVKLLPNDLQPPMSQQFTAGVRHLLGTFVLEAAYTGVRSHNIPTFYWANQNFVCPERAFSVPNCFVNRSVPGYSTILFLDDAGKTWYDALAIKVDRPYRRIEEFGWGAGLTYTLASRHTQGFNDLFSFPNPVDYPKQRRNDERHRIVSHFVVDMPYLWGVQLGGLVTLGSGTRYDLGGRFDNNLQPGAGEPEKDSFILPNAFGFRNVDLRLRKNFVQVGGNDLALTLDAFNVFNFQNLGCYSSVPDPANENFGRAGCTVSDPRFIQLGLDYRFGRRGIR